MKRTCGAIIFWISISIPVGAQQTPAPAAGQQPVNPVVQNPVNPVVQNGVQQPAQNGVQQPAQTVSPQATAESFRPAYVLGPGDQIAINAFEVEEISDKPFRIDTEGNVNLPILSKIHVDGMTIEQFEAELQNRLKTIVRQPQVTVRIVTYRSEPVFFEGLFKVTGIVPLQGRRSLIDMLQAVGGTLPNASHRIKVTRRLEFGKIPLPNAVEDLDKKESTVEISLGSLRESVNPAEDIVLQPYDIISVERAEMVYVNGEVGRVGGFELGERESIGVAQLITMVGGLSRDADANKARVLRPILNTAKRSEIPLNLKKIMLGQENDFPLLPNDILYVPRSISKGAIAGKVAVYAIPIVTSLLISVLVYHY